MRSSTSRAAAFTGACCGTASHRGRRSMAGSWPSASGVWESIKHHRVMLDRERAGREASPTAAVIDSQSTRTTEAGGPRGYDAGKKINGRKRHAMADTDGRTLVRQCHAASVQDRNGAVPLLQASRTRFPFVEWAFADAAYAADRVAKPPASPSRSSANPRARSASPFTHAAGSSSDALPGSVALADWPRTARPPSPPPRPSFTPPPSCYSYAGSYAPHALYSGP